MGRQKPRGASSKGRLSVHDRAPEGPARGTRRDRVRVWVGKRQAASGCWVGKRRAASSACALHPCLLNPSSLLSPTPQRHLCRLASRRRACRAGDAPGATDARPGQLSAPLAVPQAHLVVERLVPPVPLQRPRPRLRLLDGPAQRFSTRSTRMSCTCCERPPQRRLCRLAHRRLAWRAGGATGAPEARPGQLCAPRHKDKQRPRV